MQCLSLRMCFIAYQAVRVQRKLLVILTFSGMCHNSVLHCIHHDLQCLYQCFKRRKSFAVMPVVTCVAAAPQICMCRAKAPLLCTNMERQLTSYQKIWCQTTLPEGEGRLEYWAKLLYCFKQLGGEKPMVGCKSVSVLTLNFTGTPLTAFKLEPDSLCVVTFVVCARMAVKDQLELIPPHKVCTLLLQNLMAQCETEESFNILNQILLFVAEHL